MYDHFVRVLAGYSNKLDKIYSLKQAWKEGTGIFLYLHRALQVEKPQSLKEIFDGAPRPRPWQYRVVKKRNLTHFAHLFSPSCLQVAQLFVDYMKVATVWH